MTEVRTTAGRDEFAIESQAVLIGVRIKGDGTPGKTTCRPTVAADLTPASLRVALEEGIWEQVRVVDAITPRRSIA